MILILILLPSFCCQLQLIFLATCTWLLKLTFLRILCLLPALLLTSQPLATTNILSLTNIWHDSTLANAFETVERRVFMDSDITQSAIPAEEQLEIKKKLNKRREYWKILYQRMKKIAIHIECQRKKTISIFTYLKQLANNLLVAF